MIARFRELWMESTPEVDAEWEQLIQEAGTLPEETIQAWYEGGDEVELSVAESIIAKRLEDCTAVAPEYVDRLILKTAAQRGNYHAGLLLSPLDRELIQKAHEAAMELVEAGQVAQAYRFYRAIEQLGGFAGEFGFVLQAYASARLQEAHIGAPTGRDLGLLIQADWEWDLFQTLLLAEQQRVSWCGEPDGYVRYLMHQEVSRAWQEARAHALGLELVEGIFPRGTVPEISLFNAYPEEVARNLELTSLQECVIGVGCADLDCIWRGIYAHNYAAADYGWEDGFGAHIEQCYHTPHGVFYHRSSQTGRTHYLLRLEPMGSEMARVSLASDEDWEMFNAHFERSYNGY